MENLIRSGGWQTMGSTNELLNYGNIPCRQKLNAQHSLPNLTFTLVEVNPPNISIATLSTVV